MASHHTYDTGDTTQSRGSSQAEIAGPLHRHGALNSHAWLAAGALAGLLVAASSLLLDASRAGTGLPEGVVARIGKRLITDEDYARQIARLEADKRNPLTEQDRIRALNRLIEEELLIARGIEIGLTDSAPSVRKAIAAAMISRIAVEAEAAEPGEAELRRHYEEYRDFFSSPGRLRLQHVAVPIGNNRPAAISAATNALSALRADVPIGEVRARWAPSGVPLPDAALPPMKIVDYLGPMLTESAMALKPGEFLGPVESAGAMHIVRMLDHAAGGAPPFSVIASQVAADYQRRAGDAALREYLDWLRERQDVEVRTEHLL